MQVETTKMDPRIARIHWRDYRDRVKMDQEARRKKLDAAGRAAGRELGRVRIKKNQLERETEDMKKVYWQLSQGQTILNLPKVIGDAGFNKQKLPKLAVCKASFKWCRVEIYMDRIKFYESGNWHYNIPRSQTVTVPKEYFEGTESYAELYDGGWRHQRGLPRVNSVRAMVPTIPPHLRPKRHVSKYHILWEAKWEDAPPEDPILLSRVTDRIYVVVAQWDLTPVEKMVLDGRIG